MDAQNAIITGASKGIGFQSAVVLLNAGYKVAGWSRHKPDLEDPDFLYCKVNVSDPVSISNALVDTIAFFGSSIHVLINNAGLGYFKQFIDLPWEEWNEMFQVNVNGIFHVTKAVLPFMIQNQAGHIINISSLAGKNGIPEATGYCGTKFAVRGISQALYREVKKDNIKVTCVFPGSVNTDFFKNHEGTTANPSMLHPEDVAQSILHIIQTPPNFNTSEIEFRPMNPKYRID